MLVFPAYSSVFSKSYNYLLSVEYDWSERNNICNMKIVVWGESNTVVLYIGQ